MNTVFCIQQKAHRNQAFPKKRKSICRCISLWSDKRKDAIFLHSKDKFFVVFAQKGQKLGVFHFLEYSPMKKYFRIPKNYILHFCKNVEGLGKRRGNTFALQTPVIKGCPHLLRCGVFQMESAVGIHFRRGKQHVSRHFYADGTYCLYIQ